MDHPAQRTARSLVREISCEAVDAATAPHRRSTRDAVDGRASDAGLDALAFRDTAPPDHDRTYAQLLDEVTQLREALTSRAEIDQAKGIVMAERHCDPDAAFAVLVRLSQESNVKLRDVAAALVYTVTG